MMLVPRNLICLIPLFVFVGCGGFDEEKPPEKPPEMTSEETKHMNDEMEKMKQMYQKQE